MAKKENELKVKVDRLVEKFLGFGEPVLAATALTCLSSGYDKKKTAEKLGSLLDTSKAERLADKVLSLSDQVKDSRKDSRKRHYEDGDSGDAKKSKSDRKDLLSTSDVKSMMANAQKMIEERKRALSAIKGGAPKQLLVQTGPGMQRDERSRKIALLQAQIKNKLSSGLINFDLTQTQSEKPAPLILDREGRTIDSTGREVQLTHVVPTLKANIRAQKREVFKAQLQEKPVEDTGDVKYFDPRITAKSMVRNRKSLRFHEPGKFQQMADRMRMKAQLSKLQGEISQIAKKTGITSATKLAQLAPKVYIGPEYIPRVEWWDLVILKSASYGEGDNEPPVREESITHLIEHPIQMKAPTSRRFTYMPVFLTSKERKKLRRQNRREAWKEEQEKIRLGLEPAPEPKLRMSNLMRALGTEAVQDPTKMEAHVKAQMAKRLKAHEDANAARKLTAQQRREKRRRKLLEDTSYGIHVAVFRVKDLTNMSKKFKVEVNCKQLLMTGAVIMYKDCNVVIVEGGPKQTATYKRLMLNRIKWEEDAVKDIDGSESPNSCHLVWEGMKPARNFGEIKFKICATEKLAREQLRKHGVEHYWDLAYSGSFMDEEEK